MPNRRGKFAGSRQVITEAAGPKGRFFDRPAGDKKESKRFDQSETKKKKGLYVPLDKKVRFNNLVCLHTSGPLVDTCAVTYSSGTHGQARPRRWLTPETGELLEMARSSKPATRFQVNILLLKLTP